MRSGSQIGSGAGRGRGAAAPWLVLLLGIAPAPAPARPFVAPLTPPAVSAEAADAPAPPPLLTPSTPPAAAVTPLVPPPALSTPAPIPKAGAGNCLHRDEHGRFMGWMDYQHCVFSGRALMTARWFDDFFGDWYTDEASMLLRVVSQTVATETEGLDSRLHVRASAVLPNAEKRLRLIVSDEEEQSGGQDLRRRLRQSDNRSTAALRWISLEQAGVQSDFDLGVRGLDPPDLYGRVRLRKTWSLGLDAIARLGQTYRYGSESRRRYTPQLDLEQAVDEHSVLRLSNVYDWAEATRAEGYLWGHAVSLSRALSRSRSFSYGLTLNGHTQPNWRGESVGPWAVYRSPFLRPWLFYEVEPHYTWYRERDWGGLVSVVLRLEVQYGFRKE